MRLSHTLLLLLVTVPLVNALVVVNSLDGRDVLSAIYYANLIGDHVVFVPPEYAPEVVLAKVGVNKSVFLIESKHHPIFINLKEELEKKGNRVTLYISEDPIETNRELGERARANAFVLVDDVYGYSAVSVLPYAKLRGMYLLFTNASNAEEVARYLEGRGPREVLVYGYVDEAVLDALDERGISYYRIDTGDKFKDNIEIVKRYFMLKPSKKQVILADGNAVDDTIAQGEDPIVFIGQVLPNITYNFIKEYVKRGQIKVALLVDKDYLPVAQELKKRIERDLGEDKLHVIVKFGIGIASQAGQLYPVDFFPLPGPILSLNITGATYNPQTKQLEVVYENTGNAPEYVISTIKVFVDGNYLTTVGDEEPFYIPRGQKVGRAYNVSIEEGNITVNITALYGLSPEAMEKGIRVSLFVGRVAFIDTSNLSIAEMYHDATNGDFYIMFENTGEVTVYFLPYVYEEGGPKIEGEVEKLGPKEAKVVKFPKAFKGKPLIAGATYGAREGFLIKRVEERYEPNNEWWLWLLLLIMTLILLFIIWRRSRKKRGRHGKGRGSR